ncbi:MAG: CPBP family intramembrane glutamic endopeptidase [Euryarchaeota archaeon]|nr:CPBP family intramembrane glutamic endopeptidase [Euryarchaeota archaeon]
MRRLQWALWNGSERRLRTPWRLLLGTVLFLLVSIATLLSLQLLRETAGISLLAGFGPATRPLVLNAIGGLVVLGTLLAVAWLLDRRYLSDFGLGIDREWWVDCGFGLALGGGVMTAMVVVGIAGGLLAVESVGLSGTLPQLAGLVAVFLLVGVYEELLVRGYLLTNFAEGFRWFDRLSPRAAALSATLLSSLVFGGLHATNPNATLLSTAVISAAGVMLALGYLYTGELAIPIGVHITWNAFQGLVYGLPVSGAELPVSLVETTSRGPQIVSGGAFGPEAGLLGLAGVGVSALGIVMYCRSRYGTLAIDPDITTPDLRDVMTTE